ncbi:hypothetical protein [Rickettsia tamurae]|nr:hypothetical protein [Rickettsia tamurae]
MNKVLMLCHPSGSGDPVKYRGILGHSLLYKIPWSSHGMTIRIKK